MARYSPLSVAGSEQTTPPTSPDTYPPTMPHTSAASKQMSAAE